MGSHRKRRLRVKLQLFWVDLWKKCRLKMLTMAGNRGPMMVETRGLKEANTEKPKWNEEEVETRTGVMSLVEEKGGFTEAGLKKQITVDMSAPVVGGKVSTPNGWVDVEKVRFAAPNPTNKQTKTQLAEGTKEEKGVAATKGPAGLAALFAKGPPGKGKGGPGGKVAGPPGLGDLFAGGMKPSQTGLKGGSGKGAK